MGVASRAPSAGLRAGSVARALAKRREKPYKTEQNRIVMKKRKAKYQTTYEDLRPPPGYQFMPIGTPELAERCRELSLSRDITVHLVNATPLNRDANNPGKVSHHIHRIGYHFRVDIVDEACQELGYIYSNGKFLRPEELQAQTEHSRMAKVMAKHGMRLDQHAQRESPEQVRATIKELFPRIPEDDLREIVRHAWEEGTDRVGTNATLNLTRRAQLAVIARVRHMYTDYDRLLRAFSWQEARHLVEPTCLAKLLEWRGESDQGDDEEFEEIIRETIIIDDDDDDGILAEDEDSGDAEYISDTSVEISHRPAVGADFAKESHDENSRRILDRYQPRPRYQRRAEDVRQAIGAARERMANGTLRPQGPTFPRTLPAGPNVVRIHVPENGAVYHEGKLFRVRANTDFAGTVSTDTEKQTAPATPVPLQQMVPNGARSEYPPQAPGPPPQPHSSVVASIEPHDEIRRMPLPSHTGHHARPGSPEHEHAAKRRRSGYQPSANGPPTVLTPIHPQSPIVISSGSSGAHARPNGVIDLTADSPTRWNAGNQHREVRGSLATAGFTDALHGRPVVQPMSSGRYQDLDRAPVPVRALEYDPRQPSLALSHRSESSWNLAPRREQDPRLRPVDSQVAPVQYMPLPQPNTSALHSRPGVYQVPPNPSGQRQPQTYYVSQPPQVRLTPQPVHGAPAVVQQVPRPHPLAGQHQMPLAAVPPVAAPPALPTVGYAPQQQYYYPR